MGGVLNFRLFSNFDGNRAGSLAAGKHPARKIGLGPAAPSSTNPGPARVTTRLNKKVGDEVSE